ncbi:hypothetical protein ACLKA6_000920 [Drosophila palustris]
MCCSSKTKTLWNSLEVFKRRDVKPNSTSSLLYLNLTPTYRVLMLCNAEHTPGSPAGARTNAENAGKIITRSSTCASKAARPRGSLAAPPVKRPAATPQSSVTARRFQAPAPFTTTESVIFLCTVRHTSISLPDSVDAFRAGNRPTADACIAAPAQEHERASHGCRPPPRGRQFVCVAGVVRPVRGSKFHQRLLSGSTQAASLTCRRGQSLQGAEHHLWLDGFRVVLVLIPILPLSRECSC